MTLERHGICPDVVTGDLDSVCKRVLNRFTGRIVHDPDQETNDLTKAFRYVLAQWTDVTEICIVGATGHSEAHTVGNMSLLMEYEREYHLAERGIKLEMVSDWSTISAICDSCELHVGEGRRVSLFSPDNTLCIKSEGLKWPTDDVVFDNWWKATLNVAAEDVVRLSFNHPSMALVVLD